MTCLLRPAALVVALLAVASAPIAGCAIQERNEQVAIIIDAAERTLALGPTDGALTASIRPHDVNGRSLSSLRVDGRKVEVPDLPLRPAAVPLDLAARRAVVLPTPLAPPAEGGSPEPPTAPALAEEGGPPGLNTAATMIATGLGRLPLAVAFSEWDIFVRPAVAPTASSATAGAPAGDSAWLWLDVGALDPDLDSALNAPTSTLLVPPHVVVRLLAGALTGSVRRLGTEDVGGRPTTRFRTNIDRSKAAGDLNDRDTQRFERLFAAVNITGTFYDDVEVWIDDAGVARRMRITFEQRIDALTSFDLTFVLDLGAPRSEPLPMPSADDLAEVSSLPELLPGPTL